MRKGVEDRFTMYQWVRPPLSLSSENATSELTFMFSGRAMKVGVKDKFTNGPDHIYLIAQNMIRRSLPLCFLGEPWRKVLKTGLK